MNVWSEDDTNSCLGKMAEYRKRNFRKQEELIVALKAEGKLAFSEEEIRLHMNYLDRLTNGEFSNYELMTIPAGDKRLFGTMKK